MYQFLYAKWGNNGSTSIVPYRSINQMWTPVDDRQAVTENRPDDPSQLKAGQWVRIKWKSQQLWAIALAVGEKSALEAMQKAENAPISGITVSEVGSEAGGLEDDHMFCLGMAVSRTGTGEGTSSMATRLQRTPVTDTISAPQFDAHFSRGLPASTPGPLVGSGSTGLSSRVYTPRTTSAARAILQDVGVPSDGQEMNDNLLKVLENQEKIIECLNALGADQAKLARNQRAIMGKLNSLTPQLRNSSSGTTYGCISYTLSDR